MRRLTNGILVVVVEAVSVELELIDRAMSTGIAPSYVGSRLSVVVLNAPLHVLEMAEGDGRA